MVTKLCYCRRTLSEFRGYLTRMVSMILNSSVQNHCIQSSLNIVLIRNVTTRPAEGTPRFLRYLAPMSS